MAEEVDVFVHPSLEEAHCNSLCEAMGRESRSSAAKKAAAVPWTPAGRSAAGILVNVRLRQKELAAAMQTLADDPARRAELGQAGRESVQKRFHINVIAAAYEAEFERVLKAA